MDNDREMTLEIVNMVNERNKLLDKLLRGFVLIIIVIVISMSVATSMIAMSYNNAMKECVRIYFETDYSYPLIEQSVTQDVGQTVEGVDW